MSFTWPCQGHRVSQNDLAFLPHKVDSLLAQVHEVVHEVVGFPHVEVLLLLSHETVFLITPEPLARFENGFHRCDSPGLDYHLTGIGIF